MLLYYPFLWEYKAITALVRPRLAAQNSSPVELERKARASNHKEIVMDTKKMYEEIITVYTTILGESWGCARDYLKPNNPDLIEREIRDVRKQLKQLLTQLRHVSSLTDFGGSRSTRIYYSQKRNSLKATTPKKRKKSAVSVKKSKP